MSPVEEGPSHGLDAIRDNIEHWKSAWEELEVTAEEFIDAGDRVLVTVHHRGRGRESGIEVDARFYEVYAVSDGKVVRVDEYAQRAEALEAAGLPQ
jgi:ketosteroid isomerase-like protein